MTSEKEKLKYVELFEVLIEPNSENGLDKKSKILFHRLLAIDKKERLIEKAGQLDSNIRAQAWNALWVVFTGKKLN